MVSINVVHNTETLTIMDQETALRQLPKSKARSEISRLRVENAIAMANKTRELVEKKRRKKTTQSSENATQRMEGKQKVTFANVSIEPEGYTKRSPLSPVGNGSSAGGGTFMTVEREATQSLKADPPIALVEEETTQSSKSDPPTKIENLLVVKSWTEEGLECTPSYSADSLETSPIPSAEENEDEEMDKSQEPSEAFEGMKLHSITEAEKSDLGMGMNELPNAPSMEMEMDIDNTYESWELRGMQSEETLKATGGRRKGLPKGHFVKNSNKKEGRNIKSLFSDDSSETPIDGLFDELAIDSEDFEIDGNEIQIEVGKEDSNLSESEQDSHQIRIRMSRDSSGMEPGGAIEYSKSNDETNAKDAESGDSDSIRPMQDPPSDQKEIDEGSESEEMVDGKETKRDPKGLMAKKDPEGQKDIAETFDGVGVESQGTEGDENEPDSELQKEEDITSAEIEKKQEKYYSILEKQVSIEEENDDDDRSESSMKSQQKATKVKVFKFAKGLSHRVWRKRNEMARRTSQKELNGVSVAADIPRFASRKNKKPEARPWKLSVEERTESHPGYSGIQIYSLQESAKADGNKDELEIIDLTNWEKRKVKQRFLQERSIGFSRNWFAPFINLRHGNDKYKPPICKPESMKMPIGAPEAGMWTEDMLKSPYQKLDKTISKKSMEDYDIGTTVWGRGHSQSQSMSEDDSDYSEEAYSDSAEDSEDGSYTVISEDSYDDDAFEDAPECGEIVNTRLEIGEQLTRVHPDYTCSLRRSRYRRKYFPKESFPY